MFIAAALNLPAVSYEPNEYVPTAFCISLLTVLTIKSDGTASVVVAVVVVSVVVTVVVSVVISPPSTEYGILFTVRVLPSSC